MNREDDFWQYLDRLIASCEVIIDRPKGSHHPRLPEMVYPLDYGYLAGTQAGDGAEIDVWVGSQPGRELDAVLMCVDLYKRDAELELLLGCTEDEKQRIQAFCDQYSMRTQLVSRHVDRLAWLRSRQSVRRFQPRELPPGLLEQILAAATWAPSAHNRQPWRFVVVGSPQARQDLAASMGERFLADLLADGVPAEQAERQVVASRSRIQGAPVCLVVCLDRTVLDSYPDEHRQAAEYQMGVQGVAMASENLLLAAATLGVAGVWICAPLFVPLLVQQVLDLPPAWEPQGLALLGYADDMPARRPRRPVQDVTLVR